MATSSSSTSRSADRAWAIAALRRAAESPRSDGRVEVRRPTTSELNQLATLVDHEVLEAMGWDGDQARRERQRLASAMARPQLGELVAVELATGTVIGASSLSDPDASTRSAELGCWIAAPARGRGFAAAVLRLTAELAWAGGFEQVRMCVAVDNERIHGALARIGADAVGHEARGMPDGTTRESGWYELRRPADPGATAS